MSTDALWDRLRGLCRLGRARLLVRPGLAAVACFATLSVSCAPSPVRLDGRPSGGSTLPLSGVYEAKVSAPFLGTFTGRLIAEPTKEGFRANTRPGAAWMLIGGLEGVLGPIFMPYLFPGGVILSWRSALPEGGTPGEGWLGPGGMHRYGVRTLTDSPDGPVRLVLPDGRAAALMTLGPAPAETVHSDYPLVAERMEEALRTRLFVPPVKGKVIAPSGLEAYLEQLHSVAAIAQDDIEFAFGAAMAARSNLKFFPLPLRQLDPDAEVMLSSWPEKDRATVAGSFDSKSGIGTIKAEVFLATADVDRAMEAVLARSPRAMVIDLRNCQGVELSALRVLAWVSDADVDAGTYYRPGKTEGADDLRLREAADFDGAGAGLDEAGALRMVVEPVDHPFTGPVAVLTNRRTAGSAEAIVAVLKADGRARTVGDATAGRIVLSRPVDVGQGWVLRMPAAGWTGPDGTAPGARGIEPDIRASGNAAPVRAAEMLTGPGEGP